MPAKSQNGRNKPVIANAASSSGHLSHKVSTGIAALGTCLYPDQEDHLLSAVSLSLSTGPAALSSSTTSPRPIRIVA